jgi:hypothetical protein
MEGVGGRDMREGGMICFGERVVFLGIEQLVSVRRETGSGTFDPKLHTVRFVGLPFVFTSGEGWRTDAAKLG